MAQLLQQLAIFRHFYHMSRDEALDLPSWEFDSLLEQYQKLRAAENADLLMAVNAGFNGGGDYYKELVRYAQPYQARVKARELTEDMTFEEIYGFSM